MSQELINRIIDENANIILALAILALAASIETAEIYQRTRYAYHQFTQAVAAAQPVHTSAKIPFSECYPSEDFPVAHYPWPVDVLADRFPNLDPTRDTWRYYQDFVDQHSYYGPDGNVWEYVVPDVDGDGQVCGVEVGE
ncbi:MAG: hypothetical protein HYS86_04890 [Candidatus Chisholmbacteria bacterium]|nr:hypothetical protein [Candidatus Chisholmbacteria bacterium]